MDIRILPSNVANMIAAGEVVNLSFSDLVNPEEVYTILNNCVMQAKEIINE